MLRKPGSYCNIFKWDPEAVGQTTHECGVGAIKEAGKKLTYLLASFTAKIAIR